MKTFCTLVCAIAATFLLGAAPARAQSVGDLMGSWSCALVTPDGVRMAIITTYRPDNTFITLVAATAGGVELNLTTVTEGSWSLTGDQLNEIAIDFDIVWGRLGGSPIIPGDTIWNNMMTSMQGVAGAPNIRTVTALSPTSLSVELDGDHLTCARP
jgi:hypothetical protein